MLLCWVHIYKCCIFLLDWPLYHYVMFFLSFVTVFILKSILSDISIATPAFFLFPFAWNIFFHHLTFSLCVSLDLKWVSCRQHVDGSCSFHSATLCILIGAFSALTFKVIIDMYVLIAFCLLFFIVFVILLCSFLLLFPCGLMIFFMVMFGFLYFLCIFYRFLVWDLLKCSCLSDYLYGDFQ